MSLSETMEFYLLGKQIADLKKSTGELALLIEGQKVTSEDVARRLTALEQVMCPDLPALKKLPCVLCKGTGKWIRRAFIGAKGEPCPNGCGNPSL